MQEGVERGVFLLITPRLVRKGFMEGGLNNSPKWLYVINEEPLSGGKQEQVAVVNYVTQLGVRIGGCPLSYAKGKSILEREQVSKKCSVKVT